MLFDSIDINLKSKKGYYYEKKKSNYTNTH